MGLVAHADMPPWVSAADVQSRLSARQVVTRAELVDQHASAEAAIQVHATPEVIWQLLTHCEAAAVYIPGLKHCARLAAAADGSWAIVEHDIRYSPLMPMIHSVVRSQYEPPYRVEFHGIGGGTLKNESGGWLLEPSSDGQATTVVYHLSIEPSFWIPRALLRHSLNKELPAVLMGLRAQAEKTASTQALASGPAARPE